MDTSKSFILLIDILCLEVKDECERMKIEYIKLRCCFLTVRSKIDEEEVFSCQVLMPFNMIYKLLKSICADLIVFNSCSERIPLEVVKTIIRCCLFPCYLVLGCIDPQTHDLLDDPMIVSFLDDVLERLGLLSKDLSC